MKAITVFTGESAVSNISSFFFSLFWIKVVLRTGSIGFFLVLDRCLTACSVEEKKVCQAVPGKKKIGLFVLIHINVPYIFNLMSLSFIFPSFFGFMYITLCLHCYDHNVYSFLSTASQ